MPRERRDSRTFRPWCPLCTIGGRLLDNLGIDCRQAGRPLRHHRPHRSTPRPRWAGDPNAGAWGAGRSCAEHGAPEQNGRCGRVGPEHRSVPFSLSPLPWLPRSSDTRSACAGFARIGPDSLPGGSDCRRLRQNRFASHRSALCSAVLREAPADLSISSGHHPVGAGFTPRGLGRFALADSDASLAGGGEPLPYKRDKTYAEVSKERSAQGSRGGVREPPAGRTRRCGQRSRRCLESLGIMFMRVSSDRAQ